MQSPVVKSQEDSLVGYRRLCYQPTLHGLEYDNGNEDSVVRLHHLCGRFLRPGESLQDRS
jgi:hypothetical protein